jgi:hypothetical protein
LYRYIKGEEIGGSRGDKKPVGRPQKPNKKGDPKNASAAAAAKLADTNKSSSGYKDIAAGWSAEAKSLASAWEAAKPVGLCTLNQVDP